jgi:hypothetical protein
MSSGLEKQKVALRDKHNLENLTIGVLLVEMQNRISLQSLYLKIIKIFISPALPLYLFIPIL